MISTLPTTGLAMPTDADWGRLYSYDTTGDDGLVMPFRSYYFRNFFTNWKELAMGFIYRNCGAGGDYSDITAERQAETQIANLPHFGLSYSQGGSIPVATNPYFVGLRGVRNGVTQINASPTLTLNQLRLVSCFNGNDDVRGLNFSIPLKQGVQANPFAMLGIRFVINQTDGKLYVAIKFNQNVALADEAANTTTLTDFLATITRNPPEMDAAFANYNITNLNAFFIFWPYLNNKLILQTVGAIKYA